jgi:hypothetical protein
MASRSALVTGATGVVGRYLLKHLVEIGGWDIVAVSRRKPDIVGSFEHIAADLTDPADCIAKFAHLNDLTHVFYAAYLDRPTQPDLVATNVGMLANMVDAIEPVAKNLEHVNLVEGTKWYGSHLGPFKTPAKESDPRLAQTLFYYEKIAQFFDMEVGPQKNINLRQFMADKGPVWDRIVKQYGLKPYKLEENAAWKFGDFVFSAAWDVISDMGKARRAGWTEALDSEDMFLRLFAGFRRERIIP